MILIFYSYCLTSALIRQRVFEGERGTLAYGWVDPVSSASQARLWSRTRARRAFRWASRCSCLANLKAISSRVGRSSRARYVCLTSTILCGIARGASHAVRLNIIDDYITICDHNGCSLNVVHKGTLDEVKFPDLIALCRCRRSWWIPNVCNPSARPLVGRWRKQFSLGAD